MTKREHETDVQSRKTMGRTCTRWFDEVKKSVKHDFIEPERSKREVRGYKAVKALFECKNSSTKAQKMTKHTFDATHKKVVHSNVVVTAVSGSLGEARLIMNCVKTPFIDA